MFISCCHNNQCKYNWKHYGISEVVSVHVIANLVFLNRSSLGLLKKNEPSGELKYWGLLLSLGGVVDRKGNTKTEY